MKALQGIRILDLTQALSGPFCTMQLADHGAEVIKVEEPGSGEMSRKWIPQINGKCAYFAWLNRGKKSITIDLRTDKGRGIFLKLVAKADVVVDNYRGGTMEKFKLDYPRLKEVNPRIIAASLSGYGNSGPMKKQVAFANTVEAQSGLMDLTGFPDTPPVKSGNSAGDTMTGVTLAFAITMALFRRERTGIGQQIDVSMLDTMFQSLEAAIINTGLSGRPPRRIGNRVHAGAPYDGYQAKDGWCVFGTPAWSQWIALCKMMGRSDLLEDPKWANYKLIKENEEEITDIINQWSRTKTREELEQMMNEAGIAYGSVLTVKEAMAHPQIISRDMVVDVADPVMGPVKMQGVVVKLSETPGAVEVSAPELGEHNAAIFAEVGLGEADLKVLSEEKVI